MIAALALVAACAAPGPPTSPAVPSDMPSKSPTGPDATASTQASASGVTSAVDPPAYDASLLSILPPEVDGLSVESTPDAAVDIASDPDIAAAAERIAFGLVVDPSGELAVAAVVALREGVFDDDFWRDWRDSYDQGACAQAGGVAGNAEAEIGGRTAYIGSCDGGARTYHVHLAPQNVIVSVTAIGEDRRLGERLVEGLRA